MEALVAQILVTAFSVTAGALLALAIERGTRSRTERSAEINALRLLCIEIASRRALAPEQLRGPITIDRADPDSDLNRVLRSIVLLRKEIRAARRALRPRSRAWSSLNGLVASCNVFIESVEEHPAGIADELAALRIEIDRQLVELCAVHPRDLVYRPAGSAAYSAAPAARA